MNEVRVRPEAALGEYVSVLVDHGPMRGCGQGGILVKATDDMIVVRGPDDRVHRFARCNVSVWREEALPAEDCLQFGGPTPCSGPVDWHSSLSGSARAHLRCEAHWRERLDRQAEIDRRYPAQAPRDWSPLDAGEYWDEDY